MDYFRERIYICFVIPIFWNIGGVHPFIKFVPCTNSGLHIVIKFFSSAFVVRIPGELFSLFYILFCLHLCRECDPYVQVTHEEDRLYPNHLILRFKREFHYAPQLLDEMLEPGPVPWKTIINWEKLEPVKIV